MKKIHQLAVHNQTGETSYPLPADVKVLHVGEHMDALYVWVEVDDQAPLFTTWFATIGPGEVVPDTFKRHLGTVVTRGTQMIWHVYLKHS